MALDLESCLQQSSELHAELDKLWSGLTLPQSKRGQVVIGFCSTVREENHEIGTDGAPPVHRRHRLRNWPGGIAGGAY